MSEETTEKTESTGTITIKKDALWKYSTFVLAGLVILGLIFFILPGKSPTGNVVNNPPGNLPVVGERVEVEIGDSPVLGDANAPVTMVEFSDYECPFCGRNYQQTLPSLMKHVEKGELKIVFKDFPLSFHPSAQKAAEAARCAGEQGKYWEMHDKLFENQQSLSESNYKSWAKELGLDESKFNNCLDSGKYAEAVQEDMSYGSSLGVQGTPGFFLNGRQISGACPYSSTFQPAINAELEGKDWGVTNCQFALA